MPNTPKHILVIRLSAMGDVAMVVPVLRAFIEQHPNIKITVLTRELFSPFFRDLPNVSVYNADVKKKHIGIFGLYKLSKELKALQIDAVADLHNVLRSNILKQFLSVKSFAQINKGRAKKKALVTGKKFKQLKTTHQRYADVFSQLGCPIDLSNPSFPKPKNISKIAKDIIGEKDQKWIGIAPFATYESKMYPLELMDEVIKKLSVNNRILLFGGGPSEAEQLDKIENKHSNVINLAEKLSLDEELDVISNLNVMLSMDSGNAHMAAMLGIKVVSIWGVTHPYAGFYPFGQDTSNALLAEREKYPDIPTSVYGNKYPEDYKNVSSTIKVEEIISKVDSLL